MALACLGGAFWGLSFRALIFKVGWVDKRSHMVACQNHGPLVGALNIIGWQPAP